jgi:hypothetical protein
MGIGKLFVLRQIKHDSAIGLSVGRLAGRRINGRECQKGLANDEGFGSSIVYSGIQTTIQNL